MDDDLWERITLAVTTCSSKTLSITNISISDIKLTNPWCYNTLFLQQVQQTGGSQWWTMDELVHCGKGAQYFQTQAFCFQPMVIPQLLPLSPSINSLDKLYSLPSLIALHVDPQKTLPKNT